MNAECRIESDSTVFRFCVTNKGYDDCGYFWTDASIIVENWCLKYRTSSAFLEFSEMVFMRDKLTELTNDTIAVVERIGFIEPDVQIVLNPKHDISNDDK